MKPFLPALLLALLLPAACVSAEAPSAQLSLDYLNPGLNPSHWLLTLAPDGSGHFRSERNPSPATPPHQLDAPEVDRPIQLDAAFAARLFAAVRRHGFTSDGCESSQKVAFQGWKTLSYSVAGAQRSCRFNYARDREIASLADSLEAVAATLLEGARLEKLLQYDRLGLDRETEILATAAAERRMIQLPAIRGILERLAQDPEVMERVRKRARQLLSRSGD